METQTIEVLKQQAINICQETGLTPRQLLEQRDEAIKAMTLLSEGISEGDKDKLHKGNFAVKEFIKKTKTK